MEFELLAAPPLGELDVALLTCGELNKRDGRAVAYVLDHLEQRRVLKGTAFHGVGLSVAALSE